MDNHIIRVENLRRDFQVGGETVHALRGVTFSVAKGEFVTIMGTSGSGKSTLLNILGCLDTPTSGEYWLDGEEISRLSNDGRADVRNRKIGFVFQNFNLLPRTSALENVIMPLGYTASHLSEKQMLERGKAMLERVGLADRMDHEPARLSGGQQQRVAIARALVNNPSILFADEPTGNLDTKMSEEILRIFNEINSSEGVTIVLVTHEADVANSAKRIVRLVDGEIADDTVIRK